jgi:hypothetical protein
MDKPSIHAEAAIKVLIMVFGTLDGLPKVKETKYGASSIDIDWKILKNPDVFTRFVLAAHDLCVL